MCEELMFARKSFSLFFQEVLVALSSTNYKFPNPRHLGASLKQGLFVLRLAVNCNSVESGRFVSQSSSGDCYGQWHLRDASTQGSSLFQDGEWFAQALERGWSEG